MFFSVRNCKGMDPIYGTSAVKTRNSTYIHTHRYLHYFKNELFSFSPIMVIFKKIAYILIEKTKIPYHNSQSSPNDFKKQNFAEK